MILTKKRYFTNCLIPDVSIRILMIGSSCQTSICALGTIAADRFFTIMRPLRRDQFLSPKERGTEINN
jgi:hypothetical protein